MFREGLGKVLECLEKVGESFREGFIQGRFREAEGRFRAGLGNV